MTEAGTTERRLREAAFRSLVEHGYADLSIADIGEESGHSPSLIYHYYDDKDDLLLSMLETFTERFVDVQVDEPIEDAERALRDLLDRILDPSPADVEAALTPPATDVAVAVARVYVELWSLAAWNETFRERVAATEARMRETVARIVAAGVENGEFRPVDPDETAQHVHSLVLHALHVRATSGREETVRTVHDILDELIVDLRRGDRTDDPKA